MPTSPRSKFHPIRNKFQQIRNSFHRADVGIGPYSRRKQLTGDCQEVNCPEGAREATLGCGKRSLPRNDRGFRWILQPTDREEQPLT